jgi:hypothetical protein
MEGEDVQMTHGKLNRKGMGEVKRRSGDGKWYIRIISGKPNNEADNRVCSQDLLE